MRVEAGPWVTIIILVRLLSLLPLLLLLLLLAAARVRLAPVSYIGIQQALHQVDDVVDLALDDLDLVLRHLLRCFGPLGLVHGARRELVERAPDLLDTVCVSTMWRWGWSCRILDFTPKLVNPLVSVLLRDQELLSHHDLKLLDMVLQRCIVVLHNRLEPAIVGLEGDLRVLNLLLDDL